MNKRDAYEVLWSKKLVKELDRLPGNIVRKFYAWVMAIQLAGLRETRKSHGFHDEPLRGSRQGQRSVRLNKAYRAIYVERKNGSIECVEVIEVSKHEY